MENIEKCDHQFTHFFLKKDHHVFQCMSCSSETYGVFVGGKGLCQHMKVRFYSKSSARNLITSAKCIECGSFVTPVWNPPSMSTINRERIMGCGHPMLEVKEKCHGHGRYQALVCAACLTSMNIAKHKITFEKKPEQRELQR